MNWSVPFNSIAFASFAPCCRYVMFRPDWTDIFRTKYAYSMPMKDLALIVPPDVLVMSLVLRWRPQTTTEKKEEIAR
jgi:hypothetical protein